jgi:hypothetical protein
VWLLEALKNIGGWGTELGLLNSLLIVIVGTLVWREVKRWKAKVDSIYDRDVKQIIQEHDAMWDEYVYQKRKDRSGKHELHDRDLLAGMVSEILKERA